MRISATNPLLCCGLFFVFVGLLMARSVCAAPTLTVSNLGPNLSGNLEWLVEIAPDATLFTNTGLGLGGSLAVELALEVGGSELLGVNVNIADWPLDIAGNNPFTRTVTTGTLANMANDTVFASLASDFFVADTTVAVFTVETSGSGCTTLSWGGHTVLPGTADEYEGSLVTQAGQDFAGYQGRVTQPVGDFDADCDIDGADFLEWQKYFGSSYTANDLTDWQTNYGSPFPLQTLSMPVPEPSAIVLMMAFLLPPPLVSRAGIRSAEDN